MINIIMNFKLLSLLVATTFVACAPSDDAKLPCTIEFNGDSIMSALSLKESIPESFAKLRPAYKVDDRGIGGLTLNSLLNGYSEVWVGGPLGKNGVQKPFEKELHTSQYVVIELGGNDAYGDYSEQQFESQLRTILMTIQNQGRTAIVTDIIQVEAADVFTDKVVNKIAAFRAITKKVASELNVVNMRWDTVEYNGLQDTVDGIHRTAEASLRLVVRTVEVMDQIAPYCRNKI